MQIAYRDMTISMHGMTLQIHEKPFFRAAERPAVWVFPIKHSIAGHAFLFGHFVSSS